MAEDFLAEPVWPTAPVANAETAPAGKSGEEGGEGAGNGNDGGSWSGTDAADKGQGSGEQKPENAKIEPKEGAPADEVPAKPGERKSKFDFIAERQRKKADKEAAKQRETDGGEDEESDDDDPVAPEDAATIDKVFRKNYGKQLEALERQRFENEVGTFFNKDDTAKHATDAEKARFMEYAVHPSRSNLPYESIILEVMGAKRLMEIGAKIEREASAKAGQSKSGSGSGTRQDGKSAMPDYASLTDAEIAAEETRILTGGR